MVGDADPGRRLVPADRFALSDDEAVQGAADGLTETGEAVEPSVEIRFHVPSDVGIGLRASGE